MLHFVALPEDSSEVALWELNETGPTCKDRRRLSDGIPFNVVIRNSSEAGGEGNTDLGFGCWPSSQQGLGPSQLNVFPVNRLCELFCFGE